MDGTEVLVSLADILLLLFPQTTRRPSGKCKQAAILLANPMSKKEKKRKRLNGRPHVSLSVFLPLFSGMRRTSHPGRLASPFCRPIRKFVKTRMSFCLFFFPLFSPFRSHSSSGRRRRRRQTDEPKPACPKHEVVASASDEQISLAVLEARRQQKMA